MKTLTAALLLLIVTLAGCTADPPADTTTSDPETAPATPPTEAQRNAERRERTVVDAAEIIRILEEEEITFVYTNHFQKIAVKLKDGREYETTYVPEQAGKYSTDQDCATGSGLVGRIMKSRPPEEVKDWEIQSQ